MTRVKICGVTRSGDRDAVVAAGADAVGVVSEVTVDTPREVARETAADLVAGVPPFVTSVLVTMPDAVQAAVDLVDAVGPDAVQIHGGLTPSELGALGERTAADVIAAVDASSGPARLAEVATHVDAVLVDSSDADGGGGTGRTHDWERTREVTADLPVPVVLAGGLTPDNVAEAAGTVDPFAVDVASGVEATGGVKDHEAVERFVARARAGTNDGGAAELEGSA